MSGRLLTALALAALLALPGCASKRKREAVALGIAAAALAAGIGYTIARPEGVTLP